MGNLLVLGPKRGGGAPGQKPCNGAPVRAGEGHVDVPTYYTAFHEYAVEWTPTSLTYLVDGKPYKTYCPTTLVLIAPFPPTRYLPPNFSAVLC